MAKRRPSGDGMVRKRKDGRWEGRIVVGHKSNGDSIFRYLSAGSQKELLAKLHRNIEEYRDVDLREESKMPLGEWLDRWLEEYAAPLGAALHTGRIPGICRAEYQAPPREQTGGKDHCRGYPPVVPGTPGARPPGRSTRNTGTSWPVPPSAVSTVCSTRSWTRQHRKT